MNNLFVLAVASLIFCSCGVRRESIIGAGQTTVAPEPITKSLFDDKNATISEEHIQKILDGHYALPDKMRVAFVNLSAAKGGQGNYWNYRRDEQYFKGQQHYLDLFSEQFRSSGRVNRVSVIPDILVSQSPTFTGIREAAVRTQSDIAVLYSIQEGIYTNYKLFSKSVIKAFATTQLIILDVRTGLIPFTTIVTRDFQDKKTGSDFNDEAAIDRIKDQAVLLTISEIGRQVGDFFRLHGEP